jgi:hypothetical protein
LSLPPGFQWLVLALGFILLFCQRRIVRALLRQHGAIGSALVNRTAVNVIGIALVSFAILMMLDVLSESSDGA